MEQALYRKYRPKKLSDVVGQDHITKALGNAIRSGRISHAYLFTGPRGIGKTSVARILAHDVNKLDYTDSTHLDIIEIDAASNRRIDEIRELRERVNSAPTSAKYKVYIIDEVHMLTKEAFNALLKTLEEPPAHIIFILATTEGHKLPETIVSRTQRYSFKPAEVSVMSSFLSSIAKQENINIAKDALDLIALHGQGSFRDSISILDQISNVNDNPSVDDVRRNLGLVPEEVIKQIISALSSGKMNNLLTLLTELKEQGVQASQISKQVAQELRNAMINNKLELAPDIASTVIRKLIDVPASNDAFAVLEIVLLEPILNRIPKRQVKEPGAEAINLSNDRDSSKRADNERESLEQEVESNTQLVQKPVVTPDNDQKSINPKDTRSRKVGPDENVWQQVLQLLKTKHSTLYGIARMGEPLFVEDKLTLMFRFPFHQKRLNEPKNIKILSAVFLELTGNKIEIECVVDSNKSNKKVPTKDNPDTENTINTINNIFGSSEILE